jgi:uncharacterized protein YjiS (DUF1127 family)
MRPASPSRRASRRLLAAWLRRHRYRRELARLLRTSPHLLADIGLSQAEAEREAAKPFWHA